MVFQNFSQTYAAAITSFVGMAVALLSLFGISIDSTALQFVVGNVINLVGIVWVITHRNAKGDVTPLGFRKAL